MIIVKISESEHSMKNCIYEYKSSNEDEITEMLISQIVWYFIEGVNGRFVFNRCFNEKFGIH